MILEIRFQPYTSYLRLFFATVCIEATEDRMFQRFPTLRTVRRGLHFRSELFIEKTLPVSVNMSHGGINPSDIRDSKEAFHLEGRPEMHACLRPKNRMWEK
eukprot:c23437_g1_i1 orf=67-369(-)